jgi:predicted HAD superfamily Cof-like phosphohydrolase
MEIDVKIFLDACDQKPSVENTLLYKDLIVEEFAEFIEAFNMEDDVEQLDACMDMIWVIMGYCHMKKFDIRGGWDEVAKSNLCKIDSNTDKVIRREDGKILKPEGWTPPDLTKFV